MPRSCRRGRQSLKSLSSGPSSACASVANLKSHGHTKGQRPRRRLQFWLPRKFQGFWLLRISPQPKRKRPTESTSLPTFAAMQRRSPGVELRKPCKTAGKCRQVRVGSSSGRPWRYFSTTSMIGARRRHLLLAATSARRSFRGAPFGGKQSPQGKGALGTARLPPFHGTCPANGQWQGHHARHRRHVHERHHGWGIPCDGAPAHFRRGSDAGGQVLAGNHHSPAGMHASARGPLLAAKPGSICENMRRLAMLWKFLGVTKLPWVVMGDWNCEPSDLLPTGWLAQTSGMVLVPADVTGTCLAGGERMLDVVVHSPSATSFIHSVRADPGPFHPHFGLRLRIRSEPRAEQLRCIFQSRRFPHAGRKPPQRLLTKRSEKTSAKCTVSRRWLGRSRSPSRRRRGLQLCTVRSGSPAQGSRHCLARW